MAKCGRCKREIEFGSRCENCKTKDLADRIKKTEIKKLDLESRKQIKQLGMKKGELSPIFANYSTYKDNYYKLFHKTPTFAEYQEALRNEKLQLAHAEADRIRREKSAKKHREMPDEFLGKDVDVGNDFFNDLKTNGSLNEYMKSGKSEKLKPQYEKEPESDFMGANAFHDIGNEDPNPIHRISIQNRLKAEFFNRAE